MEDKINHEIYRESVDSKITDIILSDESVVIKTEKGEIKLSYYHDQDCCESVYADFSIVKHHKDAIVGKGIKEIIIKGVSEMGFLVCFYRDYDKAEKIFIPCYNSQNGYYSSNLELIIESNGIEKKIDISEFIEDDID